MSLGSENSVTTDCWVVTDGTAGMQNQALGLAERLEMPLAIKRVTLRKPWDFLATHLPVVPFNLGTETSDLLEPPWPQIAIGCGRQSIPFIRAIKRASGGRTFTVQCQHPRVSPSSFDLVVPPQHDSLRGPNVLPLLGSPNRVSRKRIDEAHAYFAARFAPLRGPRIAVLIGGENKAYRFGEVEAERLAETLATLSQSYGLMVTTSRRTGEANTARLAKSLENTDAYIWGGEGENPYLGFLAWADAFLVTADSVNMACEAAATGKPVHIFPLPGGSAKFSQFHTALANRGIARPYSGQIERWTYEPLDETGRAAAEIRKLLDVSAMASDMKA